MVKAVCTIVIRTYLSGCGRMTSPRGSAYISAKIKHAMRVYFWLASVRALAYLSKPTAISTKAIGAEINDRGKEGKYITINHKLMRANSDTIFAMEKVNIFFNLGMFSKETGGRT